MKSSVIIPVYNQYESLLYTLKGFSNQKDINKNDFELIIIDDGSDDELHDLNENDLEKMETEGLLIKVIHQSNMGRAKARNIGVENAESDLLIFCDGDRVPDEKFIIEHVKMHENMDCIVVGESTDYFGNLKYLYEGNWDKIKQLSRNGKYINKIEKFYELSNPTLNKNRWMTLLIGNASIKKKIFIEGGKFNEKFKTWGFEHFELGIRMAQIGYPFCYNKRAKNYHIPHKREKNFYRTAIENNIKILNEMYTNRNFNNMIRILLEEDNINDFGE